MAKPNAKSEPKPKPKRDPNQPLPKPKQRGGLILKVAVGGALLLVTVWGGLFYLEKGRIPDDPAEFANFSREQVNDAVASVDWESLKGKITEQTRKLYESVPALEQKLDATLARLRGGQQPGEGQTAAAPTEGGEQPAAAMSPNMVQNARPSPYELGCQTLRDAIQVYKRSVPNGKGDKRSDAEMQRELKTARGEFEKARDQLEKAHGEAEARGDQAQVNEIEEVLMQCNTYLEDCSKRQTL